MSPLPWLLVVRNGCWSRSSGQVEVWKDRSEASTFILRGLGLFPWRKNTFVFQVTVKQRFRWSSRILVERWNVWLPPPPTSLLEHICKCFRVISGVIKLLVHTERTIHLFVRQTNIKNQIAQQHNTESPETCWIRWLDGWQDGFPACDLVPAAAGAERWQPEWRGSVPTVSAYRLGLRMSVSFGKHQHSAQNGIQTQRRDWKPLRGFLPGGSSVSL